MPNSAILTFSDPHEYQAAIRAADLEIYLPEGGDYTAELQRIDLHRLWMSRSRQSLRYVARVSLHKSRAIFFFLADAQQPPIQHGGVEVPSAGLVFNALGAEHHLAVPAGSRWAAMSLTSEDLAAAGQALLGSDLAAPSVSRLVRPGPSSLLRLRDLHEAATDLASTAPDILAHPEVAKALEDALLRGIIGCLAPSKPAEGDHPRRQRVPVMKRFEEVLEAYSDGPLYLTEVCAKIGVSGRTLRCQCQEHLGMSPHRYLWLRRMHLAHRALASADKTKTVTEIAVDYGFGELGRFAVAYRRLFGETPSLTLRRPRLGSGALSNRRQQSRRSLVN